MSAYAIHLTVAFVALAIFVAVLLALCICDSGKPREPDPQAVASDDGMRTFDSDPQTDPMSAVVQVGQRKMRGGK